MEEIGRRQNWGCMKLVALSCLVWCVALCQGQYACVPFRGSPATGHKCDVFLDNHNVLLSSSYEEVDAAAAKVVSFFGAYVPVQCRAAALQLICQSYFPSCTITGSGVSVTTPCRSVCETTLLECLPFLESLNATALAPNCDLTQMVDGVPYPVYPPDGILPCFPYTPTEVAYSQADCPYPLKFDSAQLDEGPVAACLITCPVYVFGGEAEYEGMVAAMYVTTVPSMLCSLVMIITWLLNPAKRRYPAILIVWLAVSSFGVSFFVNLSVLVGGPRRTTCTWDDVPLAVTMDNAHENNGQGVVCIMQAIGAYYFGLTCNFWWLAVTVNIFLMMCFNKHDWLRRWSHKIHYGFHVFCWGVPLAGLIAMLSMKRLGADGINTFCQIRYNHKGESWVDWVFYTAPIMFCLLLGTILMFISMTRFAIVQLRYERSRASELVHLLRLVLLVAAVWLNNVFYVAYRIYVEDRYNTVTDSIVKQVYCSFLTGTDCDYDVQLNYPFYIVTLIASLSTGVCVFLTMCTTKSTLSLWWHLLKGLRHPRNFFAHTRLVVMSSHSSSDLTSPSSPSSQGTEMSLTPPTSQL